MRERIVLPGLKLLRDKKYFVLDMDGTFYLGDRLLEGSLDFIRFLEESGCEYVFLPTTHQKARRIM